MSGPSPRKLPPWTVHEVHELFDGQFEKDQQEQGREDEEIIDLPAWTNTLADQLTKETDHPEQGGVKEDHLKLGRLAMAAVLGEMGRFARKKDDISVAGAREFGATREEVAVATGCSNGVSAKRRYVADQRECAARGDQFQCKRTKETEEAAEGEDDSQDGASLSRGVPGRSVPTGLVRSGGAVSDSRPTWVWGSLHNHRIRITITSCLNAMRKPHTGDLDSGVLGECAPWPKLAEPRHPASQRRWRGTPRMPLLQISL